MIRSIINYNILSVTKTTLTLVWDFPKIYNVQTHQTKTTIPTDNYSANYEGINQLKISGQPPQSVSTMNRDLMIPKGLNRTLFKATMNTVLLKLFHVNLLETLVSSQITF